MNELLYGADDERRIVGVHEFGEDEMIIYTRTDADEIKTRRESFRPFMHMTERACEKAQEGFNGIEVHELSGQGVYDRLVTFERFRQFWSARSYLNKHFGQGEIHIIPSMSTQYLTWTGKTLFGGMTMDDIHRMQVDIETYGSQGFPNAERPEDEVIIISFTDNRGLKLILHTSQQVNVEHGFQCRDEQHLLTEFVRTIHRYNPDVLELHNGFGFDLPYLRDRCEMHDVPFALGRDNSKPSTYKSKKKFAEREQEYENFHIAGRNVIDSMFQAVDFDVYYRGLPNYKLKDLAKHFGIAAENRTYVAGDEISWYWDNDPKPLLKYALDDVIETRALVEELGNASFELTKILPFTYQDTLTAGTSGSIEALMAREYVRRGEAIPEADAGSPFGGGYTEMFRRGVYRDLAYADVSSLYPSIMLNYNVKPEADTLDIFKPLLQNLTDMRLETKAEMRAMDDSNPRKGLLNAQQQAYKILINCFAPGHQMMTLKGVKNVEDVEVGDLVPSLNTETGKTEWKPVTKVYEQENYTGEMVKIENRYVDLLVTPNHRVYTERKSSTNPGYTWKEASDLFDTKQRHALPPTSSLDQGIYLEEFKLSDACDNLDIEYKLDESRIKDPRRQSRWIPNEYEITDVLELMGWYVSEGSVYVSKRKEYESTTRGVNHKIQISNKTPNEREEIKNLLQRMNLNYYESVNGYSFSNKLWGEVLVSMFGKGSKNKGLPQWLFVQPSRRLKYFWKTLYIGDGDKNRNRYTTKSKRLANDVKRLAFHMGWRSHITKDSGVYRVIILKNASGSTPNIKHNDRELVDYSGPIYCVEVADNHTVYAGRNGKMNWVGQSFYGALGFRFFPWCDFTEAARVTREGRKLLKRLIAVIEEEGGRAISCDSVTEDTPVYIRRDGEIDIVSIAQLHQMGCQEYLFGQRRESNSDIEVLTQSGWSRYSYTYKHETDKEIIQTTTHRGSIKTTKDHSLMMGGEEVRPEDISVGDVLDSYDLELDDGEEGSSDYDIGFFFGAMAGDGSASRRKRYKSGRVRRSVCFHNQDSELINKIRGIVKKEFGFEMNLYDSMKSSGTNRLSKESRGLWEKVGPHLYDEATREKKVPPFVLNGSEEIKKGFLDGYEASDGNRGSSGRVRYTSKSHVLTAGVALLMKSLGMDYIVGCRSDKESVLRLGETPTKYQHEVKKQRYRGKCSNAVYDISTDDGTFVAGVGCITAHNTDGVLFEIPESWEDVDHMIADVISEKMPEGIDIDNDGEFDLVLAYKKKNYVLKPKGSDSLKLKGNSLTGRSIEGVFRQYIREQVHALTSEDLTEARQIHESLKQRIISRAVPIDELRKRGRLKKTLKGYKCGVEEEGKPRLAQYELAFEKWDRTGVKPLSGDLIWYYIAGNKKSYKIRNWRDAKLADDYQGDENINYYLGRLDDVADMFRKMVSHPDYIYSMDTDTAQGGLFGDAAPAELTISNSQIEDTPTGFRYYKPTTP